MRRPATKRLEVIPATFEDAEERVLVTPASKRLEPVAATYKTETEQILVRPAYIVWKRSSELTSEERAQQKIDPTAGEILCLVDVPAQYSTLIRQVMDTAAMAREVDFPAEYTTVKKTVIKTPATTREVEIPAEFSVVKKTVIKTVPTTREVEVPADIVRSRSRVVTPARETKIEIPAEYEEVTKQVVKTPATSEWREILCDTNATPQTLVSLQQARSAPDSIQAARMAASTIDVGRGSRLPAVQEPAGGQRALHQHRDREGIGRDALSRDELS